MKNIEFMPKALSVGDWISVAYHPDFIGRVTEIVNEDCLRMEGMPYPLFFGEYWPIELTDKIIDKNGLKEFRVPDDIECKYVHQLQHALRILGIEKEIVL